MEKSIDSSLSPATLGRLGGLLYLVIITCGLFTEFVVRGGMVVPGDAGATAANIVANPELYRVGFVSDLVMILADLSLAVVLYVLLRPVNQALALAAAFTRLAMDATLAVNLLNHFQALILLSGADYLGAFSAAQLHAMVGVSLEAHSVGYSIGLVFFAFHCLVLAYLLKRSAYFPSVFGVLFALSFVSYLTDSMAKFLVPGYDTADFAFIMLPALITEVSFCLWLLIKGTSSRAAKPAQVALASS